MRGLAPRGGSPCPTAAYPEVLRLQHGNPAFLAETDFRHGLLDRSSRRLRPVLQRLLDAKTPGIALRPLGPIGANFYASAFEGGRLAARLLFNVR